MPHLGVQLAFLAVGVSCADLEPLGSGYPAADANEILNVLASEGMRASVRPDDASATSNTILVPRGSRETVIRTLAEHRLPHDYLSFFRQSICDGYGVPVGDEARRATRRSMEDGLERLFLALWYPDILDAHVNIYRLYERGVAAEVLIEKFWGAEPGELPTELQFQHRIAGEVPGLAWEDVTVRFLERSIDGG